ncbi:MAG: YaiI/YqxD family protein [bacterium]|nr:YaiI/YqxD family protein [bacterium]
MKIFVDADACPVKETIVRLSKKCGIPVVFVVSTAGYFDRGWHVEKVLVDSLPQAVDIAIINRVEAGDVVVTQDYGLASLVLGKGGKAISPRGYVFHDQNIDRLMLQRHIHSEARKNGMRTKGPRKRSNKDDVRFSKNFNSVLERCLVDDE